MTQLANVKTIKVRKVYHNNDPGRKENWTIYGSEAGEKYTVWDQMLVDQLGEGVERAVSYTTKQSGDKIYYNIVGIAGVNEEPAGNPFTEAETNNLSVLTSPAPAPTLASQVSLIVDERMRAYDSAILMYIHNKIELREVPKHADQALAYYHDSHVPAAPAFSTNINPDDYLK